MRSTDPAKYAADPRHKLYLHYLRIIAEYEPAVFVMENVKGILSSRLDGERIFARILHDLEKPGASIGSPRGRECSEYDIHPCVDYGDQTLLFRGKDRIDIRRPDDYIVRCERHDIPQRRHRVILIGIRRDVNRKPDPLNYCAEEREFATVRSAIGDLPKLRSDLSSMNGWKSWPDAIREAVRRDVVRGTASEVLNEMHKYVERLGSNLSTGSDHCEKGLGKPSEWLRRWSDWFIDERLENVCNHSTRTHIGEDLQRYFFAACFSRACRRSPKISEFPSVLWPKHRNITEEEPEDFIFEDRFRVQLRDAPATTVTSHISKDGHYFIHYDPAQCRSLTVREAARLQTFPDNYFFAGPRTSQYHQVGNAVPPLLAHQIARQVQQILSGAGKSSSGR